MAATASSRQYNHMDSSVGLGAEEEDAGTTPHTHTQEGEEEDTSYDYENEDGLAELPASTRGAAAAAGGGDAMSLLASYYGITPGDGSSENAQDEIDCGEFSVENYVRKLLQQEGMESLLTTDDELVQEVKRLDSDMQMLVYENYSKFISATDTIRKMKNNVNDMKTEMDSLVKNMEGIASRMQVVNSFLAGKRAKVDKLVSVRRLLKRLDFLFDLPINLTRYVQRQDYAMAVTCYTKAIDILRQHTHVPSFKSIQRESDQIIAGVRDELQRRVDGGASSSTTPAQLSVYLRLLLELGVPRSELQTKVLKGYKGRFAKILAGLQAEEEKRTKEVMEKVIAAAAGGGGGGGGGEMAFGTYVEEALTRLDQAFLREFEEAVGVYRAVFLIAPPDANTDPSEMSPVEEGGEEGSSPSDSHTHTHTLLSPGGLDRANPAYSELLEMVHSLFSQQYMGALHKLFKANLAVIAATNTTTNTHTPTHPHYPINALKHVLTGGIRRLHSLVKEASPMEQGVQLVQDVAKGLIFLEFRQLQTLTLQRLVALQEQQASSSSPRTLLDTFLDSTLSDLTHTLTSLQPLIHLAEDGSQAALTEVGSSSSLSLNSGINSPSKHSHTHKQKLNTITTNNNTHTHTHTLVSTDLGVGQYVFQFVTWVADAAERVAGVTFRLTENDVVAVEQAGVEARRRIFPERFFAHPSSFSSLLVGCEEVGVRPLVFPSVEETHTDTDTHTHTQASLVLAVLCREMHVGFLAKSTAVVARLFPTTAAGILSGGGGGGGGGDGGRGVSVGVSVNKLSAEDVIACLNSSAARLLQHFVELQGAELALLMKKEGLNPQTLTQAQTDTHPSTSTLTPTQATWSKTLIMRLEALVKELGGVLNLPTASVGLSGGRRGERTDLSRNVGTYSGAGAGGRGGKTVHIDIERIFTVKVQVFGGPPVEFTIEAITLSILKAACKALIEWTRQATLTRKGYCQLQVDVHLLRQCVGVYVKEGNVIETLLDECLISAGERTAEPLQGGVVDGQAIGSVVTAEYTRLCAAVVSGGGGGGGGGGSGGVRR